MKPLCDLLLLTEATVNLPLAIGRCEIGLRLLITVSYDILPESYTLRTLFFFFLLLVVNTDDASLPVTKLLQTSPCQTRNYNWKS